MTQQRLRTGFAVVLAALLALAATAPPVVQAQPAERDSLTPSAPSVALRGVAFDVSATSEAPLDSTAFYSVRVRIDTGAGQRTEMHPATLRGGDRLTAEVQADQTNATEVAFVKDGTVLAAAPVRVIPAWWSILPPLLAIGLALAVRRVIPALFLGVWLGAVLAAGLTATGVAMGLFEALQTYVLGALADESHAAIIIFTLMIAGMVGIISKNGGTQGLVDQIAKLASTPQRGQAATGLLGLTIFFDDYANTLVVGNTMRPVTDRLRISREKLAYVVDSTAAPIACLAFATTWVGYEVGLIGDAVANIGGLSMGGYAIFLNSIAYSFYPILALFFVFAIATTDREFGPMLTAERRARRTGKVLGEDAKVDEAAAGGDELAAKAGVPTRWVNAVVPVLVLVGGVLVGLYLTGRPAAQAMAERGEIDAVTLSAIIGQADSYAALMGGSLAGVLVAAALSIGQRILSLEETVEAWYAGMKVMLFTMIVLVLAWALSEVTSVLHTADYLAQVLGASIPPGALPALVFLLAAATAFATGSSWGTMAILMPLVVPLIWTALQNAGMADPEHYHVLYSAVSCVLAGAVWGDHCSPISDTTILSSMASGCDHIAHVRTQLPYAGAVGLVALLLCTLPAGFGVPWWGVLPAGAAVLIALLMLVGTPLEDDETPVAPASGDGEVSERAATPVS